MKLSSETEINADLIFAVDEKHHDDVNVNDEMKEIIAEGKIYDLNMKDADGNIYDFAFGMNWSGVINDERVKKYR